MSGAEIDRLIQLLAKLPGLGPRSARRAVLYMLKRRDAFMLPLGAAIGEVAEAILPCRICGNLDTTDPCPICADANRDGGLVCVIEDVADLWAIERTSSYAGKYHVLGGILSALDGIRPEDLTIGALVDRAAAGDVREVILAMNATVEGQSTAHYLTDRLAATGVKVSRLAHGVPIGGELDYLDEGTLAAALKARRPF
ncbi:MAG TPA: recombination mediator RecR [Aliidongia sp.]|uniref:recombination mediator RecR n=1 Tax=Aliidongia sp. TaxID=1914230 RepID=UPI002DDDBAB5|nr:recombination mediator RecR [Aliidongia sp.]HEV2675788.1 recombination mediator RecR [Aliidongia sp.]